MTLMAIATDPSSRQGPDQTASAAATRGAARKWARPEAADGRAEWCSARTADLLAVWGS
jgi:hypothetical protein